MTKSGGVAGWMVLVVACGSAPPTTPIDAGAGVDTGAVDAAIDASIDAAGEADAGTLAMRGRVAVLAGATPQAVVAFYGASGVWFTPQGDRCSLSQVDAQCVASYCFPGVAAPNVDAGDIGFTIVGGPTTIAQASVAGSYGMTVGTWAAGDTVNVSAVGATFPAFDASVTLPAAPVAWTPPARGDATGLRVSWTATSGSVLVTLRNSNLGSDQRYGLVCTYDGSAGAALIPPSALSHLAPSTDTATLTVGAVDVATVDLGMAEVDVLAIVSDEVTTMVTLR